jgi:serine/threonine-protein kinase
MTVKAPSVVTNPPSAPSMTGSASSSGENLPAAGPAPVFDRSGRYQILATLGTGGMGSVHKALDMRLGRFVALKRLHAAMLQQTNAVDAFLREARLLAQLRHFNLPEIYDIDQDAEGPFISMEFIAGDSLLGRFKSSGKFDPRVAFEIGEQVCAALTTVHKAGIVHRDIKPANVLLTGDGVPKLIDFGIANAKGGARDAAGNALSAEDKVAGTARYSPPEQLEDATRADARSDVYSLGATLYAVITGTNPDKFDENRLPAGCRKVLSRAMAPDREQRFRSAEEFRVALREAMDRGLDAAAGAAPPADAAAAAKTGGVAVAADDRPLLEKLRDEVRAQMDAGNFREAIGVWQRIGKLTGDAAAAKKQIDRCQARLTRKEVTRLLEGLGRLADRGQFAEADEAIKEIYKLDPGNQEATVWADTLRNRRLESVKKLYFDAKAAAETDAEIAEDLCKRALAVNRDRDMTPKLERLLKVSQAKRSLNESDRHLKEGDRQGSLEKAKEAVAFLEAAVGLPRNDPVFVRADKRVKELAGAGDARADATFQWSMLAAASPGLATLAFAQLLGGGWLWVAAAAAAILPAGFVGLLWRDWKFGAAGLAKSFVPTITDLIDRQTDRNLVRNAAFVALGGSVVLLGVVLLVLKLVTYTAPAVK